VSWSGSVLVDRLQTSGITDPQTGDPVRTGDIIPDVAVDPASGAVYAVWQDSRFSGGQFDSIAFSQSWDGGLTWSTPIKVNLTPGDLPAGDQQAFTASVHVAADGTIGVTYSTSATTCRRPRSRPTTSWSTAIRPPRRLAPAPPTAAMRCS